MADQHFPYDIFLSHNQAQKDWTRTLARRLRDDNFKVWFDEWELPKRAGRSWIELLVEGVEQSRKVALIWSAEFFKKEWPTLESRVIQQLDPVGWKERVIPVLHTSCPIPKDWSFLEALDFTSSDHGTDRFEFHYQQLVYNLDNSKPFEGDFERFKVQQATSKSVSPETTMVLLPGKPPFVFGRERECENVVVEVLTEEPKPIPILGPAGIGKSTLVLSALHDPRVVSHYGSQRYFVRCDGIRSRTALASEIARAVGLSPSPSIETAVVTELSREPTFLVLDNLETPWEFEPVEIEELLARLGTVPKLALIITMRGAERPGGVRWQEAVRPSPLEPEPAREAFLAVAGHSLQDDPLLDQLLDVVDRLPLAINLLAHAAEGEPDLKALFHRWQRERTTMLRRVDGQNRLNNLELSYELSINSPRITAEARRFLRVLALLPGGVARDDLDQVFPTGMPAIAILRKVGLAFDSVSRLRMLAPLRAYVSSHYPPGEDDLRPVVRFYLELGQEQGPKLGTKDGAVALERIGPEATNIEYMLLRAVEIDALELATTAKAWAEFVRFTGLGSGDSVRKVAEWALRQGNPMQSAVCLKGLGDIALARSDHENARKSYEQALPLYRQVGGMLGEANCIKGLGNIALERSDHEEARKSYEQALPLYRQIGHVLGEANCIKSLGDIARERTDHEEARKSYEQALPLYRQIGHVLGEANCIYRIGDIALRRSDFDQACKSYEHALPLYQQVGSVLGEANCIKSLGDIALERSDQKGARKSYEQALPLYRQVGAVLGEANCIQSLGDISLERSDFEQAGKSYERALSLYVRIPEPYSIGQTHLRLARMAILPEVRDKHLALARTSWESIGRQDLIESQLSSKQATPPVPYKENKK
jgi:tetratricopeptide (TPR) repeat protein